VEQGQYRVLPAEFRRVQELAKRAFGLEIKAGKEALVGARLARRMRATGMHDVRRYLDWVQRDASGRELLNLADALTTNFTSFRREPDHFDFLAGTIAASVPRSGDIRIWSAGCSTGEEPYSILFELLEALGPSAARRIRILASDLSGAVLDKARRGVYPLEKLSEMPSNWRCYLEKGEGRWAGHLRVATAWRKLIEFERLNLMEPFHRVDQFHAIFCRNVMIYFDRPTQSDLVQRLSACLQPGGWLLIGHSEGLAGLRTDLTFVQPAVYRKPGGDFRGAL
jgi:chemotaxis protein methyltransferase CheR